MDQQVKARPVIKMKNGKKQGQVELQLPSSASAETLKFKILKVKRKADGSADLD